MIKAVWPSQLARNPVIVADRDAILDLAPHLERLAERCSQSGAMHWLRYFLDEQAMRRKVPLLVLVFRSDTTLGTCVPSTDLLAAALFSEYCFVGIRTGAITTDDAVGFRTIIAPEGERAQIAALATRALVDRGARIVLATFAAESGAEYKQLLEGAGKVAWAERRRTVGRTLALQSTFDATLASLGKSTRFNLRYYRRRLLKEMELEFIPEAASLLLPNELSALNAGSLNPVSAAEFGRRVQSASSLPGSFLMGLRQVNGPWLSLVGGWRQAKASVLHWQMNAAGWEKHSVGTIMRSYLLEHEISIGAQSLLIYGGTAHTMRHAFEPAPVTDLIVKRRGLKAFVLQKLARFFASARSVTGRPNYLAEVLHSPELSWSSSRPAERGRRSPLLSKPADLRKAR